MKAFLRDDRGQNLVEYALIACLIGMAAVLATTRVGTSVATLLNKIGSTIANTL